MPSHPSERERNDLDPLRLYLNQATQTPLLTREEEKALAARMHRGNQAQAALFAMAKTVLIQHLRKRKVRTTLGGLRTLLSPSLLRHAQELALLKFRGG